MKKPRKNASRPPQPSQRTFTWAVRSTDIPFMAHGRDAALEGTIGCNCSDCGCGEIRFDPARSQRTEQDERP